MKPIHLLMLFLLAVLIVCAVFSSRILALYYQIEGGNLLTKVLQEAYPDQSDAIACTLAPLTDRNWREQVMKAIDDLEKALQ